MMRLSTLNNQIAYLEKQNSLSFEDVLTIFNAVFSSFRKDVGHAASACEIQHVDMMDAVAEDFSSVLWGMLDLYEAHQTEVMKSAEAAELGLSEAAEELKKSKESLDAIAVKVAEARRQKDEATATRDRLKAQNAALADEIADLQTITDEISAYERSIEAYDDTTLQNLRDTRDSLKADAARRSSEYHQLSNDIADMNAEIPQKSQQLEKLTTEYKEKHQLLNQLEQDIQAAENEKETADAAILVKQGERNTAVSLKNRAQQDLEALEREYPALDQEAKLAQNRLTDRQNEKDQLKKQIAAENKAAATIEADSVRLTKELATAQDTRNDAENRRGRLEEQIQEAQNQIAAINKETDSLEATLSDLQEQVLGVSSCRNQAVDRIVSWINTESNQISAVLAGFDGEIQKAREDIRTLNAQIPGKISELQERQTKLNKLKEEKSDYEQMIAEGDAEITSLNQEIASLRATVAQGSTLEERRTKLQRTKDKLTDEAKNIHRIQNDVDKLEKKIRENYGIIFESGTKLEWARNEIMVSFDNLDEILSNRLQKNVDSANKRLAILNQISKNLSTESQKIYNDPYVLSAELETRLGVCTKTLDDFTKAIQDYSQSKTGKDE